MALRKLGPSNAAAAPGPSVSLAAAPRTSGKVRKLQLRLHPDAWRRIKALALDEETSLEALGLEAFSLLFERRGLPPIEAS